jgi:hypothetical protein
VKYANKDKAVETDTLLQIKIFFDTN